MFRRTSLWKEVEGDRGDVRNPVSLMGEGRDLGDMEVHCHHHIISISVLYLGTSVLFPGPWESGQGHWVLSRNFWGQQAFGQVLTVCLIQGC